MLRTTPIRRPVLSGILLASILLLAAGPDASSDARAQTSPAADIPTVRVAIDSGVLVGIRHDNADVFRNIPYAAPPVGPLRWRPPQPAPRWSADRLAIYPGPSCPQPMNADNTPNLGAANGPTSEDCLQLNVFAPRAAEAGGHAPVMVWLHGGGHRMGAGWIYDGQNFARDGVVVVTINYRLGPLGYFAHPALTKAAPAGEPLANYGLMDQIAALKWVQRNIAAFGGDPGNVTIFGESAGGQSVLTLLATPAARGLYHKAIVESGGGWERPITLAQREQAGAAALQALGVPPDASAETLRALPVEKLTPIAADYRAIVDGRLLTETPTQALARGHAADVPLIIGSNSGEDSLMGAVGEPPALSHIPPALAAAYKPETGGDPQALARLLFTDGFMGAPARWVAAKAARGQPAWLYYFSYVGTRFRPTYTRAFHAAEIQYVWEYWGRRTPMSVVSDEDRATARRMHACWVSFAKTSAPRCGEPEWPAYDPARDQLMEFGAETAVRSHFRKAQLDAVQAVALPAAQANRKPN